MSADGSSFVYFKELRLSNVKAFTPGTVLDLRLSGRPAPWTLIVGENGLGKTTLLQCLALLRPTLNVPQSERTDAREPDRVEPALPVSENEQLIALARVGEGLQVELEADFSIGVPLRPAAPARRRAGSISTSASFSIKAGDLSDFKFSNKQRKGFKQPLVVAYSAARHAPYRRVEVISDSEDSAASLFNPEIELVDAEQVLENLDYLSLRAISRSKGRIVRGDERATRLNESIKNALARILPEIGDPSNIHVYGPPLPGRSDTPAGVWVKTYSGEVPISALSLGYQTMFAWTVDLAWRMAKHNAASDDPLVEPAIVLIDELDLHLHPKWQRTVRRDLTDVFPQVQFIVTTHSPVLAQTYLDTNIAVVRKEGDRATIENEPKVVRTWRLDQVIASLLYDVEPYPPAVVEAFRTRGALLHKAQLSEDERRALEAANAVIVNMPIVDNSEDQKALELIREAAQLIATRPQ
jgi:energy-coupling factor transporter ATP-binding protein EcfA2